MISKAHPMLSAAQPYYIITSTKKISSSTLEAGGWTKAMSPRHGCDSLKDTGRRWNKTIQGHVKLFTMADSPQRKRTLSALHQNTATNCIMSTPINNLARVLPMCERGGGCIATVFEESSTTS